MAQGNRRERKAPPIEHVGLVVADIDTVTDLWSRLLGIGPWTVRDIDTTGPDGRRRRARLASCALGPVRLEFLQPIEGMELQSEFLQKRGGGLHHIGFTVDDLETTVNNVMSVGATVLSQAPGAYAFIAPKGLNVIIEFLQRRTAPAQQQK